MQQVVSKLTSQTIKIDALIQQFTWTADGLIPAIAQQHDTGEVLMLAWMNQESLRETLASGRVVYWSRSRQQLWRKGDTSGQVQKLIDCRVDCDQDCLLLLVDQIGVLSSMPPPALARSGAFERIAGDGARLCAGGTHRHPRDRLRQRH